mgnify:FL=1|jgi:hypothetical protein
MADKQQAVAEKLAEIMAEILAAPVKKGGAK